MTLEITGRLAWYNGMRDSTASRFNRLRGRVGFDLSPRWRTEFTYAGSNVSPVFPLTEDKPYSEREEALLAITEKDSLRTTLNPSLSLFLRQDRENWGNPFRLKESASGWNFICHAALPHQKFNFRQSTTFSNSTFPTNKHTHEMRISFELEDSLKYSFGDLTLNGSVRQESLTKDQIKPLPEAACNYYTPEYKNIRLHGGMQFVQSLPPIFWTKSSYLNISRPLEISPEFSNTNKVYDAESYYGSERGIDKYLKYDTGVLWRKDNAYADFQLLSIAPVGDKHNIFKSNDSTIFLQYAKSNNLKQQIGFSGTAVLPLAYGFRLDSWWFSQFSSNDWKEAVDSRGFTRLYFEKNFFKSPLTIRSHISHEYIGKRSAFSNYGIVELGSEQVIGFRISATIRGVTLIWGTENLLNNHYDIIPGYEMIGKEEYIAFIWKLWL